METTKKCVISRYDESITKPPFKTIKLTTIEIDEPDLNDLGEEFAERLKGGCRMKGYQFKFYTGSKDKNFDYEIVVY